jgi:L-seryl-tRNA(Ser) seleniumtransferase
MTPSIPSTDPNLEYRKLPSVDALLRLPPLEELITLHGAEAVTAAVRQAVEIARGQIRTGEGAPQPDAWSGIIAQILAERERPTLRPLINATGVIVHTNLGRAPLSLAARRAVEQLTTGYNNLEYDLDAGGRGSRYDHTRALLCELTGAEDALIVNNNASAVYFVLAALCTGRNVIISRGELVEIGGGFRIPDVLRQSGARLIEVGTTNRTHPADFEDAIGFETAALMRVHSSNFRQIGFVSMPSLAELVEIAGRAEIPNHRPLVIDDLGSGTLIDTAPFGLAAEPTVQQSIAAGADLVTFSGDKLLGGPQAGLIVGTRATMAILRRHPMARALRVDKMTLAALDATLRSYARGRAVEEIPVWQMIAASAESLRARAERWRERLASVIPAAVIPGESTVGGGSLPGETLPTFLLALDLSRPQQVAARLRQAEIPVICRIWQDRVVFDPRTVAPEEEEQLVITLQKLAGEQ